MMRRWIGSIAVAACVSMVFAGCSSAPQPSGETDPEVIGPVIVSVEELPGTTQELRAGQMLSIKTDDVPVDAYRGVVSDTDIAEFVPGRIDDSAEFTPGVEALKPGETTVTLTMNHTSTAKEPIEFSVRVAPASD